MRDHLILNMFHLSPILIYALTGAALAIAPVAVAFWRSSPVPTALRDESPATQFVSSALATLLLVAVSWATGSSRTLTICFTLIGIAASWRLGCLSYRTAAVISAILLASRKLLWWKSGVEVNGTTLATILIFFLAIEIIRLRTRGSQQFHLVLLTGLGIGALFMCFSTGLYGMDEILFTTWHHWSSFVGPAELVRAGARIFYDTPAQYSLGPTATVALGCSYDCWSGMYFIVGASNFVYVAIIAAISLRMLGRAGTGKTIIVLVALFLASLLYTSYPLTVATPSIAPSTGGLRFLPCALMVAYLVFASDKPLPFNRRQTIVGTLLWTLGVCWSPEAAFHVTFVWWPVYLWRSIVPGTTPTIGALIHVAGQAVKLAVTAAGIVAALLFLYFSIYGVLPTTDGLFAYVLYPPGAIPLNPWGAFLFFALTVAIAAIGIFSAIPRLAVNSDYLNRSLPPFLALYATSSYYLVGRSEDNNLLNLMPFLVLALLVANTAPDARRLNAISSAMLCVIIALTANFGWATFWGNAIADKTAIEVDPSVVRRLFDFRNPASAAAMDRRENERNALVRSSDIEAAGAYISATYGEPVTLMAPPLVLMTRYAAPWTVMHVAANLAFMPRQVRLTFLERTMQRLHRGGWIITQESSSDPVAALGRMLASDVGEVYTRDVSLQFGSYTATRFVVRQ